VACVATTGIVSTAFGACRLAATAWTSTMHISQGGTADVHRVVQAAHRPIAGVVATLEPVQMPASDSTWAWPTPSGMSPGADYAAIRRHVGCCTGP
jgi:hypothetical protein